MCRYLRCETNARQVPRKGAGVISPPRAGVLLGSDTRRCLRCEDNARHVPCRGAGVVDSPWSNSRRGVASRLAMCGGQISLGSTRRIKDLTKSPRAQ
jgi:hypothetical protein